MTGLSLDPSTVHREARRQGQRAQRIRDDDVALTRKAQGIARLSAQAPKLNAEHTLVIEIDAWRPTRERDDWGRSKRLRRRGEPT